MIGMKISGMKRVKRMGGGSQIPALEGGVPAAVWQRYNGMEVDGR